MTSPSDKPNHYDASEALAAKLEALIADTVHVPGEYGQAVINDAIRLLRALAAQPQAEPVAADGFAQAREKFIAFWSESPNGPNSCAAAELTDQLDDLLALARASGFQALNLTIDSLQHSRDSYKAALAARPPVALPSPSDMAAALRAVKRGSRCPLCGWDYLHDHSPRELIIYRNGVKFGRLSTEPWTGADYQSLAEEATDDAGATGGEMWAGSNEHHEHRERQSGPDGTCAAEDRPSAGVRTGGDLQEQERTCAVDTAVARPPVAQQGAAEAAWRTKFDELLEDYAMARVETALFNVKVIQRGRLARPRLEALQQHVAAQPVTQGLTETDSELLNFIGGEYLTLEPFEMPTGAGDADVGWRTIQHHRNSKRIASEVYEDDPREAIRQAMARIARDPYCTRPLHEDALSTAHPAQADEGDTKASADEGASDTPSCSGGAMDVPEGRMNPRITARTVHRTSDGVDHDSLEVAMAHQARLDLTEELRPLSREVALRASNCGVPGSTENDRGNPVLLLEDYDDVLKFVVWVVELRASRSRPDVRPDL